MRRWLAIAALSTIAWRLPCWPKCTAGREVAGRWRSSDWAGGFSSSGSRADFSSFRFRFCMELRYWASVWTVVQYRFTPALSSVSRIVLQRFSPACFRPSPFPSSRFLLAQCSRALWYYGYPAYYGGTSTRLADYYPGVRLLRLLPSYSAQNDIAQQQRTSIAWKMK